MEKVLLKNIDLPDSHRIDTYIRSGGYRALSKVLSEYTPEEVIDLVKRSGLRGRGGAGFPAGVKWIFMPKGFERPKYLICNADESEPGTFKDRVILERDPHQLLEGIAIASYAMGVRHAYLYLRGEFPFGARRCREAVVEAQARDFLGEDILGKGFDLDIHVHLGAGAYICGEETALMESLEGKRGWPRIRPPFPAAQGLFGCPTTINNVETLCNVPHIIERGVEWYTGIGPEKNHGPKLYGVSGPVVRPGVYELPMSVTLPELLYDHAGGLLEGCRLKGVIPGGSSTPILTPEEIEVGMNFDALQKAGSMLGSAGVIVLDHTICIVRSTLVLNRFYAHESCGQCTPCREGTGWLELVLERLEHGEGEEGDVDLLIEISDNIMGNTICPLGDAAAMAVGPAVRKYKEEFEHHIRHRCCLPETTGKQP
jgi:NADH-quinone oxidoreductase subunit F